MKKFNYDKVFVKPVLHFFFYHLFLYVSIFEKFKQQKN